MSAARRIHAEADRGGMSDERAMSAGPGEGPTGPLGPQRAGEGAGDTAPRTYLGELHSSADHRILLAASHPAGPPQGRPGGVLIDADALLAHPLANDRPARPRAMRRLQTARAWADPGTPAARCGLPRHGGGASIVVGAYAHQIYGLERCRSVWACPVCSPALRWRQAELLAAGLERAMAASGSRVQLITFTTPHHAGQALDRLFAGVAGAWSHLVEGRRWQLAQRRMGIGAWARGIEVTLGPHGWHPHLHVVVVRRGVAGDVVAGWLADRWASASAQVGLGRPHPQFGVVSTDSGTHGVGDLAGYVCHMATEAVGAGKSGRDSRYAPLQLLDLVATDREPWAREAWASYVRVTRGRHPLLRSRSLRRWMSDPAEDPHADDRSLPSRRPVAAIPTAAQWARLAASPYGLANLVALFDAGRDDQAAALLAAVSDGSQQGR